MIERSEAELPPDPGSSWGRAVTWGAVSGLVFASLVIATWGFVALGLDRDVIELPGVGILVAPLSVAAATIVVASAAAIALRRRFSGRPGSLWVALPGGLLAWLAFALVSGVVASWSRPEPGEADVLAPLASEVAVGLSTGPFGLAIVPLSAIVVVAVMLSTARPAGRDRGAA
ncbi:hypothetical protein C5B85_12130 [Pseudoclavibacter sp. AY1F1]|uniref:hypothetical protein n=1 Tax=Pseudoclavibacter sp. AY1F1 TaxID=2080583 RepID=UPI000CE8470C|nr:hypothetical protein [Pseudoclavibacter sp. AY1F1]PPF43889.1 hypothetical protein C5B85_12130 [Pseudoclavibacter sp. AY1F1]